MDSITLPLNAIGAADLPRVGGKGANLGELTRAGFPVPPGFCVTTAAFRQFMETGNTAAEVYAILESLSPDDVDAVRAAGQQVRARLSTVAIPPDVAAAVVSAWQVQGEDNAYAVRSSATAEDLPGASFAGQQDTYLNCRGRQSLLDNVRACWISLFTDRAILYRIKNGFSQRAVTLAVVVQQMVLPDIAGILFTADPVSGNRQILTIDAGYGLGEALVSGLVSPDLYKVDKRTRSLVSIHVADKQIAIRPRPDGGTYRESLDENTRHARVLDDDQITAIVDLGMRIEAHYGQPQDVEWCSGAGKFYIVQARPITSLFPLPAPRPTDAALHIYMSFSHAQVMTDPMPPLAHSFWDLLLPFGKGGDALAQNPDLCAAAGRLYLDLTPLLLMPGLGHRLPNLLTIADALSAHAIAAIAARSEFRDNPHNAQARAHLHVVAGWLLPLLGNALARLLWLPPVGAANRVSGRIDTYIEHARARLEAAPDDLSALAHRTRVDRLYLSAYGLVSGALCDGRDYGQPSVGATHARVGRCG